MKKSLNFYSIYSIILIIAIQGLTMYLAYNATGVNNNMDKAIWIAIIGGGFSLLCTIATLIGSIIFNTRAINRDAKNASLQGEETRSAVKDVKADTSDAKPKIDNINKNTDKIRDEVVEKIIPSLKEFENASSKISDIHKDMEYKQRLKNETSPALYDKDRFLGGIEKLYEENAKLTNENRNLKVELTDKELKLKSLEAELKVVREENEKLKATQTPTKSHDSMTQDFSL